MDAQETTAVQLPQAADLENDEEDAKGWPAGEEGDSLLREGSGGIILAALVTTLLALLSGLGMGYIVWGGHSEIIGVMPVAQVLTLDTPTAGAQAIAPAAVQQVAPIQGPALPPVQYIAKLPSSYTLPIRYGMLGPKLVEAGVIDLPAFSRLYEEAGNPLSKEQKAIVDVGSEAQVEISQANAHFLLNFFWAVGLANRNPLLLEGPMQADGPDRIDQFASTGGWTLASKPIKTLVASLPLIDLTGSQQQRLQVVAENVYRPCCGNSTAFPDCNHGMAMLGVLELMAANDASEDEMFAVAYRQSK